MSAVVTVAENSGLSPWEMMLVRVGSWVIALWLAWTAVEIWLDDRVAADIKMGDAALRNFFRKILKI